MFIKTHNFTATALLHFRDLQRTSFAILEETAANQVLQTLTSAGYQPAHTKHPGEVLGHRAIKTPNLPFQFTFSVTFAGIRCCVTQLVPPQRPACNERLGTSQPFVEYTQDIRPRSARRSLAGRAACRSRVRRCQVGRNFDHRRWQSTMA